MHDSSFLLGGGGIKRNEMQVICTSEPVTLTLWIPDTNWRLTDHLTASVLYFLSLSPSLFLYLSPSVSEEGGPGLHSLTDLYHRVPVLPTWGRTVLQFFPLPETGEPPDALIFQEY